MRSIDTRAWPYKKRSAYCACVYLQNLSSQSGIAWVATSQEVVEDEFCAWGLPWEQLLQEGGSVALVGSVFQANFAKRPFWQPVDLVGPAKVDVAQAANFGMARCVFYHRSSISTPQCGQL